MSVKKNFLYNVVYQMLAILMPLITSPYIARVIGAEGVGIYSYSYSITTYFMMLILLGVNNYGNRSIAAISEDKEKLNRTFSEIYCLQFILGISMIFVYFIYVIFFVKDNKLIAYVQSIFLISAMLDINWLFFGLEKFKLTVSRNMAIKVLSVICIFIFVKNKSDLIKYALIMGGANFLSNFILWLFATKYIKIEKVKLRDIKRHIKPNLILFIPVIAVSLYKIMDKIMLGNISDMIQVGYYENTEKIINIPMGIITALGTVMLPRMSNLAAKGDKKSSEAYLSNSIKFVMFIACAISFGLMAVGPTFSLLFFGEGFKECGILIKYLAIAVIFISWANVIRTQYLIPNKKDKVYIVSVFIGAIVNIIINIILIPKFGAFGAVIGTIFAEMSVMIYQTISVYNNLPIKSYFKSTIIFWISGIIMLIVIKKINIESNSLFLELFINIGIGAVIYLTIISIYYIILSIFNSKNILKRRGVL